MRICVKCGGPLVDVRLPAVTLPRPAGPTTISAGYMSPLAGTASPSLGETALGRVARICPNPACQA